MLINFVVINCYDFSFNTHKSLISLVSSIRCDTMTIEGQGRLYEHVKGRIVLYIPADVHKDSAFPFMIGEQVRVKIDGKKLIIEKV